MNAVPALPSSAVALLWQLDRVDEDGEELHWSQYDIKDRVSLITHGLATAPFGRLQLTDAGREAVKHLREERRWAVRRAVLAREYAARKASRPPGGRGRGLGR